MFGAVLAPFGTRSAQHTYSTFEGSLRGSLADFGVSLLPEETADMFDGIVLGICVRTPAICRCVVMS